MNEVSSEDEDDKWWETPNEHSKVKIRIVSKYFEAWAKIIGPRSDRMHYIDPYAGRGAYADGYPSTPVNILTFATKNEDCRAKLVSFINDGSKKSALILRDNINKIENIDALANAPRIYNRPIDSQSAARAKQFQNLDSSYVFVDPYGGKGVSLEFLEALLKHPKTDGFLFFNYNRNNMWIGNQNVEHLMRGLFGDQRFDTLKQQLDNALPGEREKTIIETFQDALLQEISARSVPFKFVTDDDKIYYLFGISKNRTAFRIMKDVIGEESSAKPQGVPEFEWNPSKHENRKLLYEHLKKPVEDLVQHLPIDLAGKSFTPEEMVWEHGGRNHFLCKNYQEACISLWKDAKVDVDNLGKSGKLTQKTKVIFPAVPR